MAVQDRLNVTTVPFIRSGESLTKEAATIQQDAARSTVLSPFTVMAKKNLTVPTTGTADAGNTGNGTVTGVAAAAGGVAPIVGAYVLTCTFAVVNGGVFKLEDPNGNIVADNLTLRVGAGLATTFVAGGLIFTITDAATDFAADDFFTITTVAVGKWVPFDPSAIADGSALFAGIYLGDEIAAATLVAGDVTDSPMLVGGACTIDSGQLVFENSAALATAQADGKTLEQAMAAYGIFVESTVDIDVHENA